jgi:bifunctional DNA-binding transcriptional regulator/antitoxin component of YhaV-PrlF toxin-antitoxin module
VLKKLTFKVKLLQADDSSATGIEAPFSVQEVFGTKARVPVRGTINGFAFRSSLMPMGGCHMMAVNRNMREGAGLKAGDMVEIVMERDEAERSVEIPPPLKKELAKSKTAAANWEKQSYSNQREMARSITDVKQDETRVRRLAKVVDILKTGKKWTG